MSGAFRPSRPPAAPRATVRSPTRKAEIVAAATLLFAERGYEGASMADLADRVGIRKASLFHHVASKDELYGLVLTDLIVDIGGALQAVVTAEGSYAERLGMQNDVITDAFRDKPYAARLLVREIMEWTADLAREPSSMPAGHIDRPVVPFARTDGLTPPQTREELARVFDGIMAACVGFLREGQRAGEFDREADPIQLFMSIFAVSMVPFCVDGLVERLAGASVYSPDLFEARKAVAREHIILIATGGRRPR